MNTLDDVLLHTKGVVAWRVEGQFAETEFLFRHFGLLHVAAQTLATQGQLSKKNHFALRVLAFLR